MIKRKAAPLFLLMANIVLLAHAVVPHHFHKDEVCFAHSHHTSDCTGHDHSDPGHQHDDQSSSDDCVLKQAVFIPSTEVKAECSCIDDHNGHTHSDDFQLTVFHNVWTDASVPLFYLNTSFFSYFTRYSGFVATVAGMRAPPLV